MLEATVRVAVSRAGEIVPELPVVAGGKSLGGRMTSGAMAAAPLDRVRGLVFLGFPLHPPGQPGTRRADHLQAVDVPMLFLQGTRDGFAQLDLITDVTSRLGPRATLYLVEGADHSFGVPRKAGRTQDQVLDQLGEAVAGWGRSLVGNAVRG
jgi:predicted alpha/beta-hydrolase family hydrolase